MKICPSHHDLLPWTGAKVRPWHKLLENSRKFPFFFPTFPPIFPTDLPNFPQTPSYVIKFNKIFHHRFLSSVETIVQKQEHILPLVAQAILASMP